MATPIKEGDRVQIVDREATAEDIKSGLFYNHFRGLIGKVQNVYSTQEVSLEIEQDSLTETVVHRHIDVQEQMKSKWLDGLSEEARNRLTEQEKDFRLRYTILVNLKDLVAPGSVVIAAAARSLAAAPTTNGAAVTRRATAEDLAAAEEAELERRRRDKEGN